LYDGSKKFNNLKSASHSKSDQNSPGDTSTIQAAGVKSSGMVELIKETEDSKSLSPISVSGTSNISKLVSE
jgi:hypothetical protein